MRRAWIVTWFLCVLFCFPAYAENPDWPKSLTIGTASPGGVYLPYGRFLAQLWTDKLGIPVDAVSTQGPVHNVKLIDLGNAQIGMITMGIGLQAWNGTGDWTSGKKFRNMRALFPMYDTPFQLVVLRRSGITTLAQLEHKMMGAGPRAGTTGTYILDIMKLLGVAPEIKYGSIADLATELLAGRYEASATMTGVPVPALTQAEDKEPLTFIRLTSAQIETIKTAIPELSSSTISSKTYKSLDVDYQTFGVYNFAVGRADLPEDLVYQLVKALFENTQALTKEVTAASDTLPKNIDKDTFLPLHPGAIRYYRETGIKVPDAVVPTN
ncbi:MAG: TAXI family TRAP transporter solute-binding subunit [Alphaproteobacteria bacterium]|nr:TAXI family TRAP transporter solute-binding subunit [Alphaproteobacteria bacterium]